jgi:general secretion pathway protein M
MALTLFTRKGATVAAVGGALLLVLAALAGNYVYGKYVWGREKLADVESRHARLLGLRDSSARLSVGIQDARAALARLGHGSGRDAAQIGNELQQVLRRGMQSAGMSVINSQVMPPRREMQVERIAVTLQAEGSLAPLQLYLAALQGESPAIRTDSLAIQGAGRLAPDGSALLSIRHTVSVMRVGS